MNQAGQGPGTERGPLLDQARKYFRYEMRMNETEYNHLRTNEIYKAKVLDRFGGMEKIEFTLDSRKVKAIQIEFPVGSFEVKAAWRDMPESKEVRSRYFCTEATLVDPGSHPKETKHPNSNRRPRGPAHSSQNAHAGQLDLVYL
jgi:hypothetical protein